MQCRHRAWLLVSAAAALAFSPALAAPPEPEHGGGRQQQPGEVKPGGGKRDGDSVRQQPPAPPKQDSAESAAPKADAPSQPATLVKRDEKGRIVRLTVLPAEAAVGVMTLRPESRRQAERIVADMQDAMERFARENIAAVVRLHEARRADRSAEVTRIAGELWDRHKELRGRAGAAQEMMAFMNDAEKAELRRLVQEYLQARIEEESARAKAALRSFDPREFIRAEQVAVLAEDLIRAYGRISAKHVRDAEGLTEGLQLTPEQRTSIRAILADAYLDGFGEASPDGQAAAMRRVLSVLSPAQQSALLRRLGEPAPGDTATVSK